jgi:uncharacterized BrkB/YihY/UPF0761 family membrane protein
MLDGWGFQLYQRLAENPGFVVSVVVLCAFVYVVWQLFFFGPPQYVLKEGD